MAGKFVALVLDGLQDSDVHPTAKLVAVALADCANIGHGGLAWPSIATLSRKVSVSEAQVRLHLRTLEARHWIAKESAGKGGQGQATRYRLDLPRMRMLAFKKATAHRRVKGNGLALGKHASEPDGGPKRTQRSTEMNPTVDRGTTQRCTVAELEVEPELIQPEVEPERARANASVVDIQASGQTPLKKILKTEPESTPKHMTREEQIAYARKHREDEERLQAKENTRRMLERQKAAGNGD